MSFDSVSVIGLGYIGLPTAAMFASKQKGDWRGCKSVCGRYN